LYVEDLKGGTNKDIGPKDIFEMDSNLVRVNPGSSWRKGIVRLNPIDSLRVCRLAVGGNGRLLPD